MSRKLSPLSRPQKDLVNVIAHHQVINGLAQYLKSQGHANTDAIAINFLGKLTPKQRQFVRAYEKDVKRIKLDLAADFERIEDGTA